MKRLFILIVILMFSLPRPAHAQFGIAQALLLAKMLTQSIIQTGVEQGTQSNTGQINASTAGQLQLAMQMAQAISTVRYGGFKTLLWEAPYLLQADVYGHATPWMQAASGMAPAAPAYQYATVPVPMGDWPAYYASASPLQRQRTAAQYAWLQDSHGEDAAALQAIGDSNAAIPQGQIAVSNLATDDLASGFAATNPQLSQVALAQKQDISSTMGVQVQIQNQQLLAHILHVLVLMNTRMANEEAAKLNSDALIHEQQAQAAQSVQGLSAALASFHY